MTSPKVYLFQYSRPALPVASEWHLVHDAHVGGHVSHHVRKRVLLHEEARVGHQHQLVLGREVPGLHVVDFGVDADLHATYEVRSVDMWVLLHKLLHDHDAWVALLLDAEEELELRIVESEKRLEVRHEVGIHGRANQRLQDAHAHHSGLSIHGQGAATMELPVPVNDADDVYDPEHRPEHEDEDGEEHLEQLSIQHGATAAPDAAEDAVLATDAAAAAAAAAAVPDATQLRSLGVVRGCGTCGRGGKEGRGRRVGGGEGRGV